MGAPDTAFVRQYQDAITILAQQRDSRLVKSVMVDMNFEGEKKFYEQYGSDELIEISTRYEDTPNQLPDHRRRMVTPRFFVSNTLRDPKDDLQMLIDPTSAYMQGKQMAVNRKKDDIIISAFGSAAFTGQNGTTSQSFTAANQITADGTVAGGGSAVGMTKGKALLAKRLLDAAESGDEDRYFAHGSAQLNDLLFISEVASGDFNVVKALVEGTVSRWIGFDWIRTERLLTNGSSHRLCYAYQKKAIQLAIQKDATGRIDERPDKNYATQVYMCISLGATRLEESRIVEVANAEA